MTIENISPLIGEILLNSLEDTRVWAERLADLLVVGDVVYLKGDLGVGKTTLARCIIRHKAPSIGKVQSPTFGLVHWYPEATPPIGHADLYRLEDESEACELGLFEASSQSILLIEWPDLLPQGFFASPLELVLRDLSPTQRSLELRGRKPWQERLQGLCASKH